MRKTRATKKGKYQPKNGQWLPRHTRIAIYLRDGFTCVYCGSDLRDRKWFDITLDHLEAKSNGGFDAPSNLVTACRSCNSQRQAKKWYEYATGGAVERIRKLRRRTLNLALAKALLKSPDADWKLEYKA